MKVRGKRLEPFNLFFVDCQIIGRNPEFSIPLPLAIDTGCRRTTIMDKDAAILNFKYRKLERVKKGITGIGGKSRGWYLKDIAIKFPTSDPPNRIELLETILVSKHVARTEERRRIINSVPSLLGLDVLGKSRLTFRADAVTLELPPYNS